VGRCRCRACRRAQRPSVAPPHRPLLVHPRGALDPDVQLLLLRQELHLDAGPALARARGGAAAPAWSAGPSACRRGTGRRVRAAGPGAPRWGCRGPSPRSAGPAVAGFDLREEGGRVVLSAVLPGRPRRPGGSLRGHDEGEQYLDTVRPVVPAGAVAPGIVLGKGGSLSK